MNVGVVVKQLFYAVGSRHYIEKAVNGTSKNNVFLFLCPLKTNNWCQFSLLPFQLFRSGIVRGIHDELDRQPPNAK
ncbi:unnamed protein product [Fusarium graminearum]|uniref:Chromosome 3, complete genome n=2 Tax=Gibberella zeae TaxID=5518 RepID=A0A098DYM0_GIBZE|nr:unnamed protein product [Fusarium graminearum]CAF3552564.1 unnamed protein product [Fusarium graminearum]CAG1962360.1 unnamed protein product [Fusarium graminearum]CAG2008024.1 unnamed protein product [Fusarium graminearum]CEF86935.1 unnamed protein product [Fusarium graminearum]